LTGGTSATRRPTFSILCRHRSRWRSYVATENKESRRYRLPESAATDARLARRGYVVTLPRGAVSAPHGKPQPSNQFDGLTMTAVWPVQSSPLRPVGKSIDVEQLTCQPHARQSFAMIVPDVRACSRPAGTRWGQNRHDRSDRQRRRNRPLLRVSASILVEQGRGQSRGPRWPETAKRVTQWFGRLSSQPQSRSGLGETLVIWVILCYPFPIVSLKQQDRGNLKARM